MKRTNQVINKLKCNKGITLIALVITIIVLLILAGVAVSSITGGDGVMEKAQNAKVATDNANEEEEIKMAAVQAMADNMEGLGVLTADKLKIALNNKYPVSDEGDKIKVFANSTYTLDKNGNVKNEGETPKGVFSITSFSYTPNTVTIGGTSSAPTIEIAGTPYQGPKFTSSDTSKATVNETTGVVSGVASGNVTITVTYKNYQNVEVTETTTITVKVAFTTQNFNYTGKVETCELPAGKYKLEVWGAEGGSGNYYNSALVGGKGGYSYGTINLLQNTIVYINVGGKGSVLNNTSSTTIEGGFNGGGDNKSTTDWSVASGGGGTDIRILNNSIYSRVIVAGGGGASTSRNDNEYGGSGGYGGGVQGGRKEDHRNSSYQSGYPGTATSGGEGYTQNGSGANHVSSGSFFQGGGIATEGQVCGGGGGGWYGGGSGYCAGSGGGSGYVYTSSTASNYPSGCLLNSAYYLTNASTIAGNSSFTAPGGGTETGHSGNGYARISLAE